MKRLAAALLILLPFLGLAASPAVADEGWVITSFDADYLINEDGTVDVVEDIRVDFGPLQKHGILRDIPIEYDYDDDYTRRIDIDVISVDDGERSVRYETTRQGDYLNLRIGDPDILVSGPQRYRITYRIVAGLNAQTSWDELYWNVTGNLRPVGIETASASVTAPEFLNVTCFQGPAGSSERCESNVAGAAARFTMTQPQSEFGGLTIVVALPKGAVNVQAPILVEKKSAEEQIRDFIGAGPLQIILTTVLGAAGIAGVLRYWWLAGRDRWLGDLQYLTGDERERRRPLFAKDTVVREYQPPAAKRGGRRYRPAELGTLMDERADTLDVSATIVDLAVRGYLRITEVPKKWLFGSTDYTLEKLKPDDAELLLYERKLFEGLFEDGDTVEMSDLKNEFYTTLAEVKKRLYTQVVKSDRFFPHNPETVRNIHAGVGVGLLALGAGAIALLGAYFGAAIVGISIVLAGLLMLLLSRSMARRTGPGREVYRRLLGFREYMTVAETDRQRFNEEAGIFQEYLPYAIVLGCVDRWAQVFEDLGIEPDTTGWYVSTHAFAPLAFSHSLQSFSSSMSSAIASTPGGSGSSGFGGGGFSGGGGGGGGGGSW
ncbi:MAG TPA: DUF2207 domain-containing protein [Dehalococcoidia bacterium]|nr:DUF2207 domain-containing protein [Dehalococcoidia bacterium]